MKRLNKLALIFVIPLFAFGMHKYYISMTKINFNKEEKAIQITMRFFIDDIQTTLESRYNINLELATIEENKKADFYIEKYLKQKLKISIDNQIKKISYLGKEYKNDLIYFYLEVTEIENIQKFQIQNSMLFEEFPEQENYVKLNIKKVKKTVVLTRENDKEMLKF